MLAYGMTESEYYYHSLNQLTKLMLNNHEYHSLSEELCALLHEASLSIKITDLGGTVPDKSL